MSDDINDATAEARAYWRSIASDGEKLRRSEERQRETVRANQTPLLNDLDEAPTTRRSASPARRRRF
jgi:hypothetical protein